MLGRMTKPLLLVEPGTIRGESLHDWLVENGYCVETATHGDEALEIIGRHDYAPALIDMKLLSKDVIEVLREAKTKKPQLKIIIITSQPSFQKTVQSMKEGVVDYLSKPLDTLFLDRLIYKTLGEKEIDRGSEEDMMTQIPINKKKQKINPSLAGWEYIDAYLNSSNKGNRSVA